MIEVSLFYTLTQEEAVLLYVSRYSNENQVKNTDTLFFEETALAKVRTFLLILVIAAFALTALGCSSTTFSTAPSLSNVKKLEARRDVEQLIYIVDSGNKRERVRAIDALGNIRDPRAISTLADVLNSTSWVEREAAVKALGKMKDYMAIKPLISALDDEDKFVRESALKGLRKTVASMAKNKDLRFYKPLLTALESNQLEIRDGSFDALQLGVNALKRFQNTNLYKPLIAALENENRYVRESAATLLGDIKDPTTVEPLITAQQDKDKLVRDAAAVSLQRIKDGRAVSPLISALGSDSADVRDEATKALSRFSDLESIEEISAALSDSNPYVREGAAKALGAIGSAHAVSGLIPLLQDADSNVRFAASDSLGKLFWFPETDEDKANFCVAHHEWDKCVALGEPALKPLLIALEDKDTEIRAKASNALMLMEWQPADEKEAGKLCAAQHDWKKCIELGEPAIEPVAYELSHSKSHIKVAAANTLGKIAKPDVIPALANALQDEDQEVRVEAVKALGKIKTPQSLNALIAALDNSNRLVRVEAANVLESEVEAFRNLEDEHTLDALINALNDNNRNVRKIAARMLGKFKDSRATIPLIKALEDREFEVREEASLALKNIKDPQAIEPLVQALKSNNPEVRAHVVTTLGEFKDHRAIEPLMKTIKDNDPEVRIAAIQVLGTIRDARAVTPIISSLNDFDEKVRLQAVNVLGAMNNPQAVQPLLETLNDEVYNVRVAAGESLMQMKWKPKNPEEEGIYCLIRRDWAQCIELGKPAVQPMIGELNKNDSLIKIPVARTLGEIQDARAIEPLIAYMDSAKTIKDRAEREEIFEVTSVSLVDIGKDSIPSLVNKLTDWYSGSYAAAALKQLKWKPRSDEELVHYFVARRLKGKMIENWELTKKILLKDLESKDPIKTENALYALIGSGQKEIIIDLLSTLDNKGDVPLAEAYLNSGHEKLAQAAVNWALINGHKVHEYKKGTQPVEWGKL